LFDQLETPLADERIASHHELQYETGGNGVAISVSGELASDA